MNNLPESHEQARVRLDSLAAIDPESLPTATNADFIFTYVDITSVSTGRLNFPDVPVSYGEAPSRARRRIRTNDVLMSTVRPNLKAFAYCQLPDGPFVASTGFAVLRPIVASDGPFIFYSILSDEVGRQIEARTVGSNYPAINSSDVKRLLLPAFISGERSRIGEILLAVDQEIIQTEELINKYQQIKTGLMHDLFTRGLNANGKLRPPREEAPAEYRYSDIGWIPQGWETPPTKSIAEVIDPQPDHRTPPEQIDGYPYIGVGDVKANGEIDFARSRKVSPAAFTKQLNAYEIYPGAFIFGKIGTLGQPTRIPHERFFALSANVVMLTASERSQADFLFWIYQSLYVDRQVTEATNSTSQPALGIKSIRDFIIPWPASPNERSGISSILEAISMTISSIAEEKEKLERLKAGLMRDVLTARVRVELNTKQGEPTHV